MIFKYESTTSTDNSKIAYLRIGNQGKPKVFLFHGMLVSHHMWLPFIIPILSKYEFIIPDMRGHGKSEMNNYKSSECFELLPDDLHAVRLNVLEPNEKYMIAGFSMGTIGALLLAEKYGFDNCIKYIHIDHSTNFSIDDGTNNKIFQEFYDEFSEIMNYAQSLLESDIDTYRDYTYNKLDEQQKKLADSILQIIVYNTSMVGLKEKIPSLKYWMIEPFAKIGTKFNKKMPNYMIWGHAYTSNQRDFSPILEKINCPATFFVATKNKLFSSESQLKSINEYKPDAKVVNFDESGHDLMFNEPIKFFKTFSEELEIS